MGIAFLIMRERGAMGITEKLDLRIVSLPLEGKAEAERRFASIFIKGTARRQVDNRFPVYGF